MAAHLNKFVKFGLKLREHVDGQVTILKEAPVALFGAALQIFDSFLRLSLTQGDVVDFNLLFSSILVDHVCRVNTLSKNDKDRNGRARVTEDLFDSSRLGCDEFLTLQCLKNVVSHGKVNSIRTETPQNDQFTEGLFTFGLPFSW